MTEPFQLNAGKCNSCMVQIDDNEVMSCFRCKEKFHAVCNGSNAICNKSLLVLYHQKSTKRNFVWYCDKCLTDLELMETESQTSHVQKVNEIESKIDLLSAKVSSITDILNPSQVSSPVFVQRNDSVNNQIASSNTWQNTSKVMIMKNNLGSANLEQLEQRIVGEKIEVTNSKRNTNGDVVITCPTSTAAQKVKEIATELLPTHTVKDPLVKYSWVNVVGFESNHSIDTVYDLLIKNNFVFEFLKGKSQSDTKEFLEVKTVKPCVKNQYVFRALIKISSSLRQVIKRGNDKLRIGLYSCRVYDQAPQIKRCNRCQRFGHWMADCAHGNGIACAKCGSMHHETIHCTNLSDKKCVNCYRAGVANLHPPHTADSSSCPCFLNFRKASYSSNGIPIMNQKQPQHFVNCPPNSGFSQVSIGQPQQQALQPQMLSNQYNIVHGQQGNPHLSQNMQQQYSTSHLNG